ncbi:tetratricopeptide repeat protein [Tessaracoccus sp. Y36]
MKTTDILEFLDTAPDEVRPWAEEQQRVLRAGGEPAAAAKGVPRPRFRRLIDTWAKPLLMAATVFAIIFGVWFLGRPPAEPATAPQQTQLGEAASRSVDVQRVAELTAQVRATPSDIDARLELGVLLLESGDPVGAEEQWLAAADLDAERVEAIYNLGFLYMSKEPADEQKARDAWERVLEIEPDFPQADVIRNHLPQG